MNTKWTVDDIRELQIRYSNEKASSIADSLHKTIASVYQMSAALGLKHNRSKGVSYIKTSGKWRAQKYIDGTTYYIGVYGTEQEAIKAYKSFQGKPPDSQTP